MREPRCSGFAPAAGLLLGIRKQASLTKAERFAAEGHLPVPTCHDTTGSQRTPSLSMKAGLILSSCTEKLTQARCMQVLRASAARPALGG